MPRYAAGASGSPVGEYDGAGNLIQETVWLGDVPVATLRPNGSSVAIYYIVTDQVDTPREVIRPSDNALMWTWYSGPFGSATPNENPAGAGTFVYDLRFPGQIAGTWGSTYQNDQRDFDTATGRYVEPDPLGLLGGSYSTYAYAGGNPINNYDPDGLQVEDVLPAMGELMKPFLPPGTTVDPALPIPDTGQPPSDPNSPKCLALKQKIINIQQDIAKREQELLENKLNLPEWLPSSITQGLQSLDKRGHRQIIRKLESVKRKLEDQYDRECSCRNIV